MDEFQKNQVPESENEKNLGVEAMKTLNYYEEEYEVQKLSALQRMFKIFISPTEVFEDTLRKKSIVIPMMAILITGVVVAILEKDAYIAFTTNMMQTQKSMTLAQVESAKGFLGWFFMGITPLALLVNLFVKGTATHLLSIPFEGKGNFSQTLAVVVYAYVVQILGMILQCIATLATGTYGITFSPALMMSNEQMLTPLYTFLASLSIFNVWYLALSIIGISVVHKIPKSKAAILVLTPFVAYLLFSVVPMLFK